MTHLRTLLAAALLALVPLGAVAAEVTPMTAPGTSDVVLMDLRQSRPVAPGIFVTFGAGASGSCTVQATAASPVSGVIPVGSGWQPADPAGSLTAITASTNARLGAAATALRLVCSSLTGGSVLFGVVQ